MTKQLLFHSPSEPLYSELVILVRALKPILVKATSLSDKNSRPYYWEHCRTTCGPAHRGKIRALRSPNAGMDTRSLSPFSYQSDSSCPYCASRTKDTRPHRTPSRRDFGPVQEAGIL